MVRRFLFLPSCLCLAAVTSWALAAPDTEGTEFIFGFLENDPLTTDNELFLSTILPTQARVVVTMPKFDRGWKNIVKLTRERVQNITVPKEIRGSNVEKSVKGIWIQANQDITVYAVNKEQRSTDAYIAFPLETLSTEYYAMTYIKDPEVMVVGTEDDTEVSITWPLHSTSIAVPFDGKTYREGDTLNLTLDKFETFHAFQKSMTADFTGAHITATKPIAVLSGNRKVPIPPTSGTADHLTEMLMPVDTWGKTFYTTSTPDREIGDLFRIVASENNTKVTFSKGKSRVIKSAGDFWEVDIPSGEYQTIQADKPVLVAMFAKTFQEGGRYKGDPSMCSIVPEPQYAADYFWSSIQDPGGMDFRSRVALIIDKTQVSGLLLDGEKINWEEQKEIHGSKDKVHLWKRVSPGQHRIYHTDPTVTFTMLVFGSKGVNSFALSAGQRLAKINAPCEKTPPVAGDIIDNDCDGQVDEETLDGEDNDGDGAIDEDLAAALVPDNGNGTAGNGSTSDLGEWSAWSACQGECNEGWGVQTRYRNCTGPDGESVAEDNEDLLPPGDEVSAAVVSGTDGSGAAADGEAAGAGSAVQGDDGGGGSVAVEEGQESGPDSGACSGLVMESRNCSLDACPTVVEAPPANDDNLAIILGGVFGGVAVIVLAVFFCIFWLIPYARGKYWKWTVPRSKANKAKKANTS